MASRLRSPSALGCVPAHAVSQLDLPVLSSVLAQQALLFIGCRLLAFLQRISDLLRNNAYPRYFGNPHKSLFILLNEKWGIQPNVPEYVLCDWGVSEINLFALNAIRRFSFLLLNWLLPKLLWGILLSSVVFYFPLSNTNTFLVFCNAIIYLWWELKDLGWPVLVVGGRYVGTTLFVSVHPKKLWRALGLWQENTELGEGKVSSRFLWSCMILFWREVNQSCKIKDWLWRTVERSDGAGWLDNKMNDAFQAG